MYFQKAPLVLSKKTKNWREMFLRWITWKWKNTPMFGCFRICLLKYLTTSQKVFLLCTSLVVRNKDAMSTRVPQALLCSYMLCYWQFLTFRSNRTYYKSRKFNFILCCYWQTKIMVFQKPNEKRNTVLYKILSVFLVKQHIFQDLVLQKGLLENKACSWTKSHCLNFLTTSK